MFSIRLFAIRALGRGDGAGFRRLPSRSSRPRTFMATSRRRSAATNVAVTSILTNPDQDPHLFEASPETAKALTDAKVVIVNGADYDPWMEKLLSAHKAPARKTIVVGPARRPQGGRQSASLVRAQLCEAAAKALTTDLVAVDPAHKADYEKGEAEFLASLAPLKAKIGEMRKAYAGWPVTASEPVFGYQAALIGLKVHNEKFALAVMNNAEPTASEVAGFESDLKGRKVKAMLYNAQASEPAVQRLVDMAKANNIPVVGVSETEPPGMTYQAWMLGQLDELDKALAGQKSERSQIRSVTIRLGGRDILSAASFVIENGEFIGMLGANGAGKTTLMRAALGLTPVASGTIEVLDRATTRGNRAIGYMPQIAARCSGLRISGYDVVASAALGADSALPGSTRRRGAKSTGRSTWWARANSRAVRSANSPAANASACCSARRCSASRSCCCSTSP